MPTDETHAASSEKYIYFKVYAAQVAKKLLTEITTTNEIVSMHKFKIMFLYSRVQRFDILGSCYNETI